MFVASRAVRHSALVLLVLAICTVNGSGRQWSRQPGELVRDSFGPTGGVCRGACGMGCPTSSCAPSVSYEWAGPDRLRRIRTFACGTHLGCRQHDDCLDRCRMRQAQGLDCEAECHREAVEVYGVDNAVSWGVGGGPLDPQRITFQYTREAPGAPQPLFRCPAGASLDRDGEAARCLAGDGADVSPVFDNYGDGPGMRLSGVVAGRVCREGNVASGVCEETADIEVSGDRAWYGFEFDYVNADPGEPLMCASFGAEDDFMGSIVKNVVALLPTDDTSEAGQVLGRIQDAMGRGASLTDILSGITVRAAGDPSPPLASPVPRPGVPPTVEVPSAHGHLLVPMFELPTAAAPGSLVEREVRCTHKGQPVLEASFRLRFSPPQGDGSTGSRARAAYR